jgi:CDP-glycerol glycerophosphotransferase
MTLLSVVLPIHNVQGYLARCLDSLLDQTFTDLEIVAVDDCSPDGSGAILADYAGRDPRVRVLTLPANAGLGPARNAGLDAATGDYVWFVDGDDWVAPGALGAIARRLRDTGADVLVVGFDRVHWDGRVEPASGRDILAGAPDGFTAGAYPSILEVLHVAWNKVVRRELLAEHGLRFEAGWYEDVSFSYPVLAVAKRISVLPRVCVHYRQRRTGAITRTLDDRHFQVFDHWAGALAAVEERAGPELRPRLLRRMIWHYLSVLASPDRVPRRSRRRFFGRIHQEAVRHGSYPWPVGGEGVRHRLVAGGNYPAYRAYDALASAWHRAASLRRVLGKARQAVYGLYYRVQLRLPIDRRLAVYAAYWYRGVSCNPAAIAAAAARLRPDVRAVWVVNRRGVASLPPGTEHVVAGTLRYHRTLARARWLINNVNWPQRTVKRPGTTHVMTHHGTPLKRMGLDQVDHPAGAMNTDFAAQMARADRWDFSLSANRHTTVAWASAYPGRHETLEVGYPRNDRLAVVELPEILRVRAELGLATDQRVILYAPTHREWKPPGTPVLDVEDLAEQLGPGSTLLVRSHYFYTPANAPGAPSSGGRIVDVSAYPVVEDLYLAADILITDYSSAMFDYAVLDRPIVIYAPDWPAYREVRGVYFDLLAQPPGSVAMTYSELLAIMRSGAHAAAPASAARAAFRERFCSLDDGHAAERVVQRAMMP